MLVRDEEALLAYEKAISLKPDDPVVWLHKGISLGVLNRDKEALVALEKVISLNSNEPMAWFIIASIFFKQGRTSRWRIWKKQLN